MVPRQSATPPSGLVARLRAAALGAVVGLLLVFVLELLHIFVWDNVHTVLPGQVYRTGQLAPDELKQVVQRYGIRTVVNLRGCCALFGWYQDECRVSHQCGIAQEDVCLSSGRLPSAPEVRRLVEVIDRAAYPLVFHCHRGIDRTGLACTLTLLLRTNATLAEARGQLGLRYAHLSFGKTGLIDRFFDLYEEWLTREGLPHSAETLRRWAATEYRPGECWARLDLVEPLPRITPSLPAAVRVRVSNISDRPWRLQPSRVSGIHLRFTIHDQNGKALAAGHAGMFDTLVPPGGSVNLTLALPPLPAGRHHLFADMEDSGHCLFAQVGSEPLEEELIVGE